MLFIQTGAESLLVLKVHEGPAELRAPPSEGGLPIGFLDESLGEKLRGHLAHALAIAHAALPQLAEDRAVQVKRSTGHDA
jgi:hypothetical protein